jgi:anti-anti-sigma factor
MQEDFSIETVNEVVIIRLNMMRATIKEAQEFKKILSSVINKGYKKILIDFTQCNFVDSSIIGVIVTSAKDLRNNNGDVKGIITEGSMLNMFAQTGLEKVFKHYPNQELALSSFII